MLKRRLNICMPAIAAFSQILWLGADAAPIHAVNDISHEFTFYADGRFSRQYLQNGHKGVSNWGTLSKFDLSNANLLVMPGCYPKVAYTAKDLQTVKDFLAKGGSVLLLGTHGKNPQNDFIAKFGASFAGKAQAPFAAGDALPAGASIEGPQNNQSYLQLDAANKWKVIAKDAQGRPLAAIQPMLKGNVIVASRNLVGSRPDASDPHNKAWWPELLEKAVAGKAVDSTKPFKGNSVIDMGGDRTIGTMRYHYSDYLEPMVEKIADIDARCRPIIEKRMGVPLSPGMASEVGLLATDGGGFSSGKNIGLATFWGDFPNREDSMIEFLTHESVHSWVLPYPEVWNEPIATYVGNLVMMDMGHGAEAEKRIQQTIKRASRIDPTMKMYDLAGNPAPGTNAKELSKGQQTDMHWGKTFWIFEQLRKENPDFLAKYFQAKRKLVPAKLEGGYKMDNTVEILSQALGKNLFPWFNEQGIPVNRDKVTLKLEKKS